MIKQKEVTAMQYCLYLRKSRADADAEARGEGETLSRHQKILLELAKKMHLNITEIYKEIVSGETIAARPVMQHMLQEVEQCKWDGVLVMEIERLARGDTIDQGIMAQAFKYSNTKIITPFKTYDPNNEFDEEYFEFGLFMSRREYKTINRRLQNGRLASVKEGKYIGSKPPYGYERIRLEKQKGWTLQQIPEEAEIVKTIFEWYTVGEQNQNTSKRLGISLIARRLNSMNIPSKTGKKWNVSVIRDILTNPVYIGKIRWNFRPAVKKVVNGQIVYSRPSNNTQQCTIANGLHTPIISETTFESAQQYLKQNPPHPIAENHIVKNPLAGIVVCGKCGHNMVRRPYSNKQSDVLMCTATYCDNISSALHFVEKHILISLEQWLQEYKLQWNMEESLPKQHNQIQIKKTAYQKAEKELVTLHQQLDNTHTLLEQGIYSTDIFLERSRLLHQKIENTKQNLQMLKNDIEKDILYQQNQNDIIPKVEHLLSVYDTLYTAKSKNDMLKEVLEKVIYIKNKNGRWHNSPDDFEIVLYPKIPLYTH